MPVSNLVSQPMTGVYQKPTQRYEAVCGHCSHIDWSNHLEELKRCSVCKKAFESDLIFDHEAEIYSRRKEAR